MTSVAILHPGRMGAAVAAQAARNGATVRWCSAGRSTGTAARAEAAGLVAVPSLAELLHMSEIVISLCPPTAAEDVAEQVAGHGYAGIYLDGNAISPQRVTRIGERLAVGGAQVIDGCVFGAPPGPDSSVRLYLAGGTTEIEAVAGLFKNTQVEPIAMDGDLGKASAIKQAQASYQKASRALAAVAYALAEHHGVRDELFAESQHFAKSALTMPDYLPSVAARAWRWAPEMKEIAESLRGAGLPPAFADAAVEVFDHWADAAKDQYDIDLDKVLRLLNPEPPATSQDRAFVD